LAYPVRAEATKHDVPGCRSPGCPAGVFAAVGTIWGVSKLGGRNITKYLHPRNTALREIVRRKTREADPLFAWGRPMTPWKKQAQAHGVPPGNGIQHPRKDFQRITSGSCREQQGLGTTCKDSRNEAKCRRKRELNGSGT